jgi:predicted protein tyrosine phosphatase
MVFQRPLVFLQTVQLNKHIVCANLFRILPNFCFYLILMNILFICSRNKKRSRTAETIFRNYPGHKVLSAGTEDNAQQRVTEKLVHWAELIFVMENVHREKLFYKYGSLLDGKPLVVLDIPDEYEYMDEELVAMLEDMMEGYFDKLG